MTRIFYLPVVVAIVTLTFMSTPTSAQSSNHLLDVVQLLANGETVFGSFANTESGAAGAINMSRSQSDYIFFDMEHGTLDMNEMRTYMQYLLDPAKILRRGRPGTNIAVWVRIPANGREMNEWMIKNVLDQGAHGVITPHIETAEQALHVVQSMRYPQRIGVSDIEPEGLRGSGPGNAVRYWGISGADYLAKADVWPLDPNGELLNMIQIENKIGISNVEEIAKVPGVSMLRQHLATLAWLMAETPRPPKKRFRQCSEQPRRPACHAPLRQTLATSSNAFRKDSVC